jgi:hypothetical protein
LPVAHLKEGNLGETKNYRQSGTVGCPQASLPCFLDSVIINSGGEYSSLGSNTGCVGTGWKRE